MTTNAFYEIVEHRGWEIVRLRADDVAVEVVPGKGGDITSVRWVPDDVELLWQSPWGLRQRGAAGTVGGSEANLMEWYPGGWQTVFPNAGPAVVEHGVEWGMHGEAWLAAYDWEVTGEAELTLRTRLVRSPFELERRLVLDGGRLSVTETARNVGGVAVEAAWGHHIAFGPPFLDSTCHLDAAARRVEVDDERDRPAGDLEPGATGRWPTAPGRDGEPVDLRRVFPAGRATDRLYYLADFDGGHASLTNNRLRLRATVDWQADVLPYAWVWTELHASAEFPWYQAVDVVGIEPHSSFPGQGLAAIRDKTGTQLRFEPGQTRSACTTLTVAPTPA